MRIFLTVLDSLGIGALPDADLYGDSGSDTLNSICKSDFFNAPNLAKMGIFNIEGTPSKKVEAPTAAYCRFKEGRWRMYCRKYTWSRIKCSY